MKKLLMAATLLLSCFAILFSQDAKSSLTLSIATDNTSYTLGDTIQVEVILENIGDKDAEISELVFEERSVVFDIAIDVADGKRKQFTYNVTKPDAYLASKVSPTRVTLRPKKSVIALFLVPTVKSGKMDIVGKFNGATPIVSSNKITVDVTPPANTTKLVAQLEIAGGEGNKDITGILQIDLLPEEAPNTVMNFVSITKSGFYDGLIFHRAVKDFVIQGGCPYGLGTGGPGYSIKNEDVSNTIKHDLGTVSMAHYEKIDAAGSQFFISLTKLPILDGKYTTFGKVTDEEGLKLLKQIGNVATEGSSDKPKDNIIIKKATVVTK